MFFFLILKSSFIVGASVNDTDEIGRDPLHWVANFGRCPLHWAANYGKLKVAQLLLQKGEITFFVEFITSTCIEIQEASLRSIECVHIMYNVAWKSSNVHLTATADCMKSNIIGIVSMEMRILFTYVASLVVLTDVTHQRLLICFGS